MASVKLFEDNFVASKLLLKINQNHLSDWMSNINEL